MSLADFYRGDTKSYSLTFTDKLGAPIPLFGKKLYFTLKLNEEDLDTDAKLQVTVTFPDTPDSAAGKGTLSLTAAQTGALDPESYFYDFQLITLGSPDPTAVTTLAKGKVKVLVDITRSVA